MPGSKLRADLEIACQSGGTIVKDPSRNKFYRFTGTSALVLQKLDGLNGPA